MIRAMTHENMSSGFLTRSDTNRAVQPQMTRGLKFQRDCTKYNGKPKALISCAVRSVTRTLSSRIPNQVRLCTEEQIRYVFDDLFVLSQQFFSHVGTEPPLPGYYQYFQGVKCLVQGHNTAEVGLEPPTSRSQVRRDIYDKKGIVLHISS